MLQEKDMPVIDYLVARGKKQCTICLSRINGEGCQKCMVNQRKGIGSTGFKAEGHESWPS